jgi:ATP-dependent phosphofructokinase / diphosphate-dependent phosphofructokinase
MAPLVVGEAYPAFKNGLPAYVKLHNVPAPKKLKTDFAV